MKHEDNIGETVEQINCNGAQFKIVGWDGERYLCEETTDRPYKSVYRFKEEQLIF